MWYMDFCCCVLIRIEMGCPDSGLNSNSRRLSLRSNANLPFSVLNNEKHAYIPLRILLLLFHAFESVMPGIMAGVILLDAAAADGGSGRCSHEIHIPCFK